MLAHLLGDPVPRRTDSAVRVVLRGQGVTRAEGGEGADRGLDPRWIDLAHDRPQLATGRLCADPPTRSLGPVQAGGQRTPSPTALRRRAGGRGRGGGRGPADE